jgi:aspartyl-tRNA(Asn)/glutamyl-tRNA(Gln) amidotransferase subunit A
VLATYQLPQQGFSSVWTYGYMTGHQSLRSVQEPPLSKPITPVRDRLEEKLARLTARDGSERAFVQIYGENARLEADAADLRLREGMPRGPLDGRIVSIKDLFDVTGEPTLAGSIIRRSAKPAMSDAIIVKRLRDAGAVIIGKTIMTEFAFTAVGLNPHYPTASNAVAPDRVAGGSSTGAAISVAEGTSDISIGSDTGGSVRIPAALNGIVGFKPTAKRVPKQGAFPLSPSLDSIGPLARSVHDCAIADAAMAGEAITYEKPASLHGLRIGIPHGHLLTQMERPIAAAFARALQVGAERGAVIVDFPIDDLIEALAEATAIGSIAGIEGSRIHAEWLHDRTLDVDQRVQRPLLRRLGVSESDYIALMQKRQTLMREMDRRIAGIHVLALPATPIGAPTIESVSGDETAYKQTEALLLRNTQVANQFDLTAITLPMPGLALPGGLMLMARHGADRRLLSMALSMEELLSKAI